MPLRDLKPSGSKWSGPLAEKQLVKGLECKGGMACPVLTGVGCDQWDSSDIYVLQHS